MQQTADVVPMWWLHDFLAYAKTMIVATFVVMFRNCCAGRPWQGSSKLAKVESSSRQVAKVLSNGNGLVMIIVLAATCCCFEIRTRTLQLTDTVVV